jgi:hypothetical protein
MQITIELDDSALRRVMTEAVSSIIGTSYSTPTDFRKYIQGLVEQHLLTLDLGPMVQRVAAAMVEGVVREIVEQQVRKLVKREIKAQAAEGDLFKGLEPG